MTSGEKILMSAELKGFVTWFIYFLDLLWVRHNCAKFHYCRICVTDSRRGWGAFCPPHPWAVAKKPILNRVNVNKDEPVLFPLSIETSKCSSGSCNNINYPYAKTRVPDVIKNLNVKVFNLMSTSSEIRHI